MARNEWWELRHLLIEEGETGEGSAFHKPFFISMFGAGVLALGKACRRLGTGRHRSGGGLLVG